MARYTVTFACGHEHHVVLYGPMVDREKKLKFFTEKGLCSECYRERDNETIKRKNRRELVVSLIEGFPDLEGTDNQKCWAITIRSKMIQLLEEEKAGTNDKVKRLLLDRALTHIKSTERDSLFFIKWRGANASVICDVIRQRSIFSRGKER